MSQPSPAATSRAEATRAPLLFQVTLRATPEEVFRLVTAEPEQWLCRGGGFEPHVGGQARLCWPDGCVSGRIVQFDAPRTIRFAWHFEGDPLPETMVVIGMVPVEAGPEGRPQSRLEVEHYGFGAGPDWEPLYVGAARAWAGYLKNLRAVVETGVDLREPDE